MILTELLALALTASVKPIDEARVSGGIIRVGDVVRFDGGHHPEVGVVAMARLPGGVNKIILSRSTIEMLAKRAVPGLRFSDTRKGAVTFLRQQDEPTMSAPCYEAARSLAAGEPLSIEDVNNIACDHGKKSASLRFDREAAAAIAVHAINEGDYLGRAHLGYRPSVLRGGKLTLQSRAGPVVIERSVVAMQGARPADRRVFVQTDDGSVFATDLAVERPR